MSMNPRTKRKKRKLIATISCFCLLVFCISTYMVVSQLVREKRDADAFEKLIAQVEQQELSESDHPDDGPDPAAEPTPEFHKYDVLYEQNHDLFGWISIDGTKLNYPVMHTPDDPEYYLHRAFDGTYSSSGVPFLDGKCHPNCGNYIVYGHHMKNGTMFATLQDYADEAFWKEHPTIHFDLLNKAGEYEVLAAFYAQAYKVDDENVFRYYDYTDLTEETAFAEYLGYISDAALYDTGVTAEYGDQLLTLTTCSYHTSDGRFVVVAREIS